MHVPVLPWARFKLTAIVPFRWTKGGDLHPCDPSMQSRCSSSFVVQQTSLIYLFLLAVVVILNYGMTRPRHGWIRFQRYDGIYCRYLWLVRAANVVPGLTITNFSTLYLPLDGGVDFEQSSGGSAAFL